MEATHRFHVGLAARKRVAVAEKERLDGRHETPFAFRRGFLEPGLRSLAEPPENRLRDLAILLGDQGMVVAQRLAPVRQGEVRVEFLCRLELDARLLPAEAVQDGDTP